MQNRLDQLEGKRARRRREGSIPLHALTDLMNSPKSLPLTSRLIDEAKGEERMHLLVSFAEVCSRWPEVMVRNSTMHTHDIQVV